MTVFSAAADKHVGERQILLVSFTDGSTTYRWSTSEIFDDTNNVWYDPIIVATGQIDRPASSSMPPLATFSITVSNAQGQVDSLLSDYSSFSPIDATVTVKRGFESIAVSEFQDVCVMRFAGVPSLTGDRLVRIEFEDDPSRQFGEIVSPTAQTVYNAMTTADSGLWPANTAIPGAETTVPVVLGRYEMVARSDGVDASNHHFDHGGALGGQTFPGQCRIVAISYTQFDVATNTFGVVYSDGTVVTPGSTQPHNPTTTNTSITWGQETITIDSVTWYVLIYKVKNALDSAGTWANPNIMLNTWRVSVKPYAPDRIVFTHWRVAEFIKGACASGDDFSVWATQADSASWDKVNEHTGTSIRRVVRETTPVSSVVGGALKQCSVYAYSTRSGKFAGLWVEPAGGPSPDYSSTVQLTEADDFLTFSAEVPVEGDMAMANVITAHYAEHLLLGHELIARIAKAGDEGSDFSLLLAPNSVTVENAASIARHNGRRESAGVGGPLLYVKDDSINLAKRESDIRSDPRVIITADLPWRAAHIELGDIVRVTHTAVPGWSADRLCIVFGVVDDFVGGIVGLTLVDYHTYLSGKVCLYDTIDDWTVSQYSDDSVTAAIVNGSSVITFSGDGDWEDVLAGDIFQNESATNQFQGIIDSLDTVANTITLVGGGGEVGPLNSTYVNEAASTAWKILRSQKNRDTASTNYAVQDDKYGCYAVGADGFFRDDSTPAYTFQR